MDRFRELVSMGTELGYAGTDLQDYVKEQQDRDRDERAREREERLKVEDHKQRLAEIKAEKERMAMEMDLANQHRHEAEREHRRKLEMLESQKEHESKFESEKKPDTLFKYNPKIPAFDEMKDDMDAYLRRFETFAQAQGWTVDKWAVGLSTLLKGKALDVYSRLAPEQALNYSDLKLALLKRFECTEDGFRKKFRDSRAEDSETFSQFAMRLSNYFTRWVELGKCEKSYSGLSDLMLREQFLLSCSSELELFLRERTPANITEMTALADKYVEARRGTAVMYSNKRRNTVRPNTMHPPFSGNAFNENRTKSDQKGEGWKKSDNKTSSNIRRCFICKSPDHIAVKCPEKGKTGKAGAVEIPVKECDSKHDVDNQRNDNMLNGKSNGSQTENFIANLNDQMPVMYGRLGEEKVSVLRDTGCNGVVVRKKLVKAKELLDVVQMCKLVDGSEVSAPVAQVQIDSPYFQGTTNVWCLDNPLYDVIIGNVPGALAPDKPKKNWIDPIISVVETRGMKNKNRTPQQLAVPTALSNNVDPVQLRKAQQDDDSLVSLWKLARSNNVKEDRNGEKTRFVVRNDILYRECTSDKRVCNQLVVPKQYRQIVLNLAHDSLMSGHLGITKTTDRVLLEFFWPGCRGDIIRHCKSCDICQRTVQKGHIRKAPLGNMPIIDQPFDRVAVDIIGPLYPASDRGHRYILTVVDFATRYPEAVALKRIETVDIAEALVDVFSRVGVPLEILSDRGSQFTSEVMQEVSRLLSIKQMTTTPYHPACNGLVEKFNGTLKQMLRRMCVEQPKNWDRYLTSMLFAYREVPQESLGFAPFELLYGHSVRGPLRILREIWSKELPDPDVKSTYQYVLDLKEKLENTCKLAHESLKSAKFKQAQDYNRSARDRELKVGDKVLLLLPMKRNKLQLQWKGPFEVVEKLGKLDYRINVSGKVKTFHINMLKKYVERQENAVAVGVGQFGILACASISVIQETYEDSEDGKLDRMDGNPLNVVQLESSETVTDVHISEEISMEQRNEINTLLAEYSSIMTDLPGRTNLAVHDIRTVNEDPIRVKPYPIPYQTRDAIKAEVDKMLAMDIIEPSESDYCSPVILLRKKDSSYRFCLDYRQLNKVTIFDAEPMPSVDDLFVKLSGCKYFSKLDLSKGYWQVPLTENAQKKSAFSTPFGLFQFKVMGFGLVNAPMTFSRLMRKLLKGMDHVDNFLDDILVYSKTWEDHMRVLRLLFGRLKEANLTARPTKCFFAYSSLECLGHIVGKDVLQPHPDKVEAIRQAPPPTTKRQVKSFIGLASYYRKFIPNFASIAVPLTDLTKKGMPNKVVWTSAQENAFVTLKKLLSSSPILRLPNMDQEFTLRTDASDLGIGAMLLQESEGLMHPIAYASRKLLPRERRYSIVEKECLALTWGVNKFSQYVMGSEFVVETDHQPLTGMANKKVANARIMRWALLLQPYRMRIKSIPGRENIGADYLSRVSAE